MTARVMPASRARTTQQGPTGWPLIIEKHLLLERCGFREGGLSGYWMMLIPREGFPDTENGKEPRFFNQLSMTVKSDQFKNAILGHQDVQLRF